MQPKYLDVHIVLIVLDLDVHIVLTTTAIKRVAPVSYPSTQTDEPRTNVAEHSMKHRGAYHADEPNHYRLEEGEDTQQSVVRREAACDLWVAHHGHQGGEAATYACPNRPLVVPKV